MPSSAVSIPSYVGHIFLVAVFFFLCVFLKKKKKMPWGYPAVY